MKVKAPPAEKTPAMVAPKVGKDCKPPSRVCVHMMQGKAPPPIFREAKVPTECQDVVTEYKHVIT